MSAPRESATPRVKAAEDRDAIFVSGLCRRVAKNAAARGEWLSETRCRGTMQDSEIGSLFSRATKKLTGPTDRFARSLRRG